MRAISSGLIKMINLAPVVRRLDNTIHWINLYPLDNVLLSHIGIYPLDSVIHPLYNWALVEMFQRNNIFSDPSQEDLLFRSLE